MTKATVRIKMEHTRQDKIIQNKRDFYHNKKQSVLRNGQITKTINMRKKLR